jgi:hypothetical protein
MAASHFTDAALRAHLDAGHSQADAARHFGVSEPAIHQRLKRMRHLTSRVVALERANEVVDEKLSATARLERVQRVIDEEMSWAVHQARREGSDRAALADVILKLAGEVRQQLDLQLAISRTLVDVKIIKEFTTRWSTRFARSRPRRRAASWPDSRSDGRCGPAPTYPP